MNAWHLTISFTFTTVMCVWVILLLRRLIRYQGEEIFELRCKLTDIENKCERVERHVGVLYHD